MNIYLIYFIILSFLIPFTLLYIYEINKNRKRKENIKKILQTNKNILKKVNKENNKNENKLEQLLIYAGFYNKKALTVFYIISVLFFVLSGLLVFNVTGNIIISIIIALFISIFPYMFLNFLRTKRLNEFENSFEIIISKTNSLISSGIGFEEAFKKSIETSRSEVTREIMSIYIKEKELIGEEEVFKKIFKLIDSKELKIFYLVLKIGKKSGGKLANTLKSLKETLAMKQTIKKEIISSTKETKIGTWIIIALTALMFVMLNGMFENALVKYFFYEPKGQIIFLLICGWVGLGIFINAKLTKIKF